MKTKYTFLVVLIFALSGAAAQTSSFDTTGLVYYDTLSLIAGKRLEIVPDSLLQTIDTTQRTLIAQKKVTDTVRRTDTSGTAVSKPQAPVARKYDKRWFISPALKLQFQDFGMLEKQRMSYMSDAHLLPFYKKGNASMAASVYKNFSGHFSMSLDLGASTGHVTIQDSLISSTERKIYGVSNATLYYHILGGHFRLQPFIAAGINNLIRDGSYTSAPVGGGVKFSGEKIMFEAQTAYGFAVSKNIAPTMMYSLGMYIPLKSKKHNKEETRNGKDSSSINITNITNNYYFLNADSLRKAQEDSIGKLEEQERLNKAKAALEEEPLDPDDPMNLPAAKKYIVYFYYDQYALTSSAFAEIDQVIRLMKENKKLHVHLKGHTDMAGSEQYNAPLSKKRAQMVFDYMNSRGIPVERMILSSYGKKKPVVKDEDPNTAWMNRRCEMVLFLAE